jgi:hypothetical protein
MPELPLRYRSDDDNYDRAAGGSRVLTCDLTEIGIKATLDDAKRQEAFDASRKLQAILIQTRNAIGTKSAKETLENIPVDPIFASYIRLDDNNNNNDESMVLKIRTGREANFAARMEELVRLVAYQYFLETSCLVPPSLIPWATDEEYLAGACMGLSQDLQSYGLGRATVRDVSSVKQAAVLVQDILDYLLQLDFRNGPLRREYDGTKYCLKDLETLLYELAVVGSILLVNMAL